MQNIKLRQRTILEIISSRPVYSQEELLTLLAQEGISATQATLSRDLKTLRASKIPGEGYRVPQIAPRITSIGAVETGIISTEFSGQIAIIKTQPGFAGAIASLIDRNHTHSVMGTLAGDDTVLLILREGYTREQTLDELAQTLPALKK